MGSAAAVIALIATAFLVAPPEKTQAIGDGEIIERLLSHPRFAKRLEEHADARELRIAKAIEDYDPLNPPKAGTDERRGFILAGTAIAAAIGWLVKKILMAILWSIIIALVLAWFKSYWWVPLAALFGYIFSTWIIARSACRGGK